MSGRRLVHDLLGSQEGVLSVGLGPGFARVRPWILGLVLLAIANVAAAFTLTLPAWQEAAASGEVSRVSQQAQGTLEPALERARRVYGRVAEAEAELETLKQLVASRSGSVSEVVSTFRAAIDASGLVPERINWQPQPVPELGLTQLQVNLPVRGDYSQLRRFLEQLLDGPIFAVVERVGVSTPSSSDPDTGLRMNVVASVFVDDEADAGPEAPESGSAEPEPDPTITASTDPVAFARGLRERLAELPPIPLPADAFDLRLDRLDGVADADAATRRNLFAFASLPVPPAERQPVEPREPRTRRPRPVLPYDLLGVIRTDDALIATIADGDDVFNVREGDRLPAGHRVTRIEVADVWLQAGRREIQLSLRKERDYDPEAPGPAAEPAPRAKKKKKKTGG